MALDKLKIRAYADGVEELPDNPSDAGITAAQLKAVFDARSNKEIKEQHNALVDEVAAHESGDNPHGITKETVGLSKVDNTADAEKPVSTAQREAIDEAKNEVLNEISVIQGPPGADGEDGVSPVISVSNIPGGHRVKITDVNGEQVFDVMDGEDGGDGVGGSGGGNCVVEPGEGTDSVVQVIGDSTSEKVIYNFITDNRRLGNAGGSSLASYTPDTVATLEADGWEFNAEATDDVVENHATTEVDNRYGIRVGYDGNQTFALNVYFPDDGYCVVYVNATQINADRAAAVYMHVNGEYAGRIDTSELELKVPTRVNVGSGYFVKGRNTIEFICSNYSGSTKYFALESMTIRGKQSVVKGLYNAAFGRYNELTETAHHSMAVNYDNTVEAARAFAAGQKNYIGSDATVAFAGGWMNRLLYAIQTAFGKYNNPDPDALFMIGIGTSENDRRNGFTVCKDGTIKLNEKPFDFALVEEAIAQAEAAVSLSTIYRDTAAHSTKSQMLYTDVTGNIHGIPMQGTESEQVYDFRCYADGGHSDVTNGYTVLTDYIDYPAEGSGSTRMWAALGTSATYTGGAGVFMQIASGGHMMLTMRKPDEWTAFKFKVPEDGIYSVLGNIAHYVSGGTIEAYMLPMTDAIAKEFAPDNTDTYGTVSSANSASLPNQKKRTGAKSFTELTSIAGAKPIGAAVDTYSVEMTDYITDKFGAAELTAGEYIVVLRAMASAHGNAYALYLRDITLNKFEIQTADEWREELKAEIKAEILAEIVDGNEVEY